MRGQAVVRRNNRSCGQSLGVLAHAACVAAVDPTGGESVVVIPVKSLVRMFEHEESSPTLGKIITEGDITKSTGEERFPVSHGERFIRFLMHLDYMALAIDFILHTVIHILIHLGMYYFLGIACDHDSKDHKDDHDHKEDHKEDHDSPLIIQ